MISVVIPSYNGAETLFQAIDSVLCQTTKTPLEILVIDDHSTDDTMEKMGNAFSGAHFRRLRRNQAGCPCVFDDRAFIFLRADRVSVYVACTGCFAECRADT